MFEFISRIFSRTQIPICDTQIDIFDQLASCSRKLCDQREYFAAALLMKELLDRLQKFTVNPDEKAHSFMIQLNKKYKIGLLQKKIENGLEEYHSRIKC